MNVADIMTGKPLTVKLNDGVEKIYFIFNTQHVRHLPVVDKGKMVGFLSDRDLKKIMPKTARKIMRTNGKTYSVLEDSLPHGALMFMRSNVEGYIVEPLTVREIMHTEVFTVSPTDDITNAATLMVEKKIGALPVLDNGKLVGIVTTTDVLRGLLIKLAEGPKTG